MIFTEEQLKKYAKPLSETEENQCKNSIRMVSKALSELGFKEKEMETLYGASTAYQIRMSNSFSGYDIKLFLQGSYANNTNVRGHSDIDIAVVQEDIFRPKYRANVSGKDYGFTKAAPRNKSFKDEVEDALIKHFDNDVERKNKSIKINGNSYRKDTDTVPSIRSRDYRQDYRFDDENYIGGILIKADDWQEIINYPEQHIKNGVEKNNATNYYFKKMVRVAKELRYQMENLGYASAQKASSFGVECLLWNIPNEYFTKYTTYCFVFEEIVEYLYDNRFNLLNFMEVNNIKKLCDDSPDRRDIYKKFIEELKGYYAYEL